ncbi:hypothetical protein PV416_02260 [Streptomyces ipomoeae]|nr:hypothetical protein [Streptomyces ipomoeae]MDX2819925.1 hypothetical protein [Streptomyces ipomoeae]MDX2872629.1 hypothetical protein [Streptomyces ipomoeae]
MRSALRKRPDSRARAAAALGPASSRLARMHARATVPARTSRLSAGSGR